MNHFKKYKQYELLRGRYMEYSYSKSQYTSIMSDKSPYHCSFAKEINFISKIKITVDVIKSIRWVTCSCIRIYE